MLSAAQYDELIEPILKLYREYQDSVINDIARRLGNSSFESAAWQVQRLSESGAIYENILEELSRVSGKSETALRRLFQDAGVKAINFDDSIYRKAGLNPIPLNLSPAMLGVLQAGLEKTGGIIKNLTMTTASSGQDAFIQAADLAYMQVSSGAMSYDQAIGQAVKKLAADGLEVIHYSGKRDKLDVAMRRTVLTGVAQTTGKLQIKRADEMGVDLVQTSAHIGARNTGVGPENHESWQGKVFSRSGTHESYPDFVNVTGYGTGAGLMGWNCRHSFYPFFEGLSVNPYSDEELERYANETVIYNEKEMSVYEATQEQRNIERKIRFWKRQRDALESAGLGDSIKGLQAKKKVSSWQAVMRDFTKQTGLRRQPVRERIYSKLPGSIKSNQIKNSVIKQPAVSYSNKIKSQEKKIFSQDYESAIVLDKNGNLIFKKDGNKNSVQFTSNEVRQMKGGILTHNHPGGWRFPKNDPRSIGNSFSEADLIIASETNLIEIRAVTPVYIFSMKPGPNGWPKTSMIKRTFNQINAQVRHEFLQKIANKQLSIPQAEALHFDTVSERLAADLGLLYNKTKHGY